MIKYELSEYFAKCFTLEWRQFFLFCRKASSAWNYRDVAKEQCG
jgi:hypothetical protein